MTELNWHNIIFNGRRVKLGSWDRIKLCDSWPVRVILLYNIVVIIKLALFVTNPTTMNAADTPDWQTDPADWLPIDDRFRSTDRPFMLSGNESRGQGGRIWAKFKPDPDRKQNETNLWFLNMSFEQKYTKNYWL